MENNNEHNIKKGHFDAFVHAVGSEIEQATFRSHYLQEQTSN